MVILEICQKQPFDIIAMTLRGILGFCCAHIAQLMTYLAIYTLPFTLQFCYKPLGILQIVTKSQNVHISSDNWFPNFITSNLLKIGSKVSHSSRNTSFPHKMLNFSSNMSYSLTSVHSPSKYLLERIVSHKGFFDIHFNCMGNSNTSITNIHWFS